MQRGVLVNKDMYVELQRQLGDIHAELANKRTKEQVNPRLRVYLKELRKLLWPRISWKSFNKGTQGVYRPEFHSGREQIAGGLSLKFPSYLLVELKLIA